MGFIAGFQYPLVGLIESVHRARTFEHEVHMVFEAVFERFVKRSPLSVMTQATMEHALDAATLDELS